MTKPEQCPHCGVRHRSITPEQCEDRHMSEKTLQERVVSRARYRGWKVAHAGKLWLPGKGDQEGMWLTPMAKGWPDLFLLKEGMPYPAMSWELKKETEDPDPDQVFWLRLLNACGIPAMVIRPSDLREGRVTALLNGQK